MPQQELSASVLMLVFSTSSQICFKAFKNVSGYCAPEMAYLLFKTKKGTPCTPIACASCWSFLTASPNLSEERTEFILSSSYPTSLPKAVSTAMLLMSNPSVR